jgi:glycosyltransferase involved in cell wall biosynthesis
MNGRLYTADVASLGFDPSSSGLAPRPGGDTASRVPIVVHSHLRWDFVWQRPQQVLTRMAVHHPILFIEEPIETSGALALDVTAVFEGITRVVPLVPKAGSLSTDMRCAQILPIMQIALCEHPLLKRRFDSPVHWFYSPMTAPWYVGELGGVGVVYDCMDELANFRFAPADLVDREEYLLSKADVVFTGGYELYRSKCARHRNTHFYGCGVDVDHFARARAEKTVVPAELSSLPRPVLGYFGVIDERLDYELIAQLAHSFPDASVVMVGPLAKVRLEDLPSATNIHWLGQRSYEDLPSLVKAFDVCLMPFALNAATQYINPTKTLEYLAAGKPVVSTAVPDVVRQFSDVVHVADSIDGFLTMARKAFSAEDPQRVAAGIARACDKSWDSTVAAMRGHMLSALAGKHVPETDLLTQWAGSTATNLETNMDTVMSAHLEVAGARSSLAAAHE